MGIKSQITTKDLNNLYHHSLNLRKGCHNFTKYINDLYLDLIFSVEGIYTINFQVDIPEGIEPIFSFELIKTHADIINNKSVLEVNYIKGKRRTIKNQPYIPGIFSDNINISSSGTYVLRLISTTENLILNSIEFEGYGPVVIYPIATQYQLRKRRHASAAYNNSYFDVENAKYFYREIIINKHQPNTYYTFAFVGGYLGLVLKDGEGKSQINFSVWNGNNKVPSKMIEKSIHPNLVYHNFNHEGKGIHSHLPYNLQENKKYGFLLHLDYNVEEKASYYTGYFIDLSKNTDSIFNKNKKYKNDKLKWIKLGCIKREGKFNVGNGNVDGIKYPTRLGGFIENTGCLNGHLWHRQFQMGNDLVSHNGEDWIKPKCMVFTCKDNRNAICKFIKEGQLLEVGIGGLCGNIENDNINIFHLDEDNRRKEEATLRVPNYLLQFK